MSQIFFGNSKIEFKIIKSKKRKTIGLAVSPRGVIVRSPSNLSSTKLKQVVRSKAKWIITKQLRIDEVKQSRKKNNKIQYLGKYYDLQTNIVRLNEKIIFRNGKFIVYAKNSRPKRIENLYNSWLKLRASIILENRVSKYKKLVGVEPSKILIKDHKMRWGSATKKASINFNLNLLKAPMKIIDYVVVHELCHLKIYDHSTSFWMLIRSVMPDYESRKEWLRVNGLNYTD